MEPDFCLHVLFLTNLQCSVLVVWLELPAQAVVSATFCARSKALTNFGAYFFTGLLDNAPNWSGLRF